MGPVLAVEALEALGPDGVAELLRLRPDLARARTTSMAELARRAVSPSSVALALRLFDLPTLQVAETLAAIRDTPGGPGLHRLLGITEGDAGAPARAMLEQA